MPVPSGPLENSKHALLALEDQPMDQHKPSIVPHTDFHYLVVVVLTIEPVNHEQFSKVKKGLHY